MSFFWYNPFSGEKLSSQFVNYLQARSFVNDVRETIVASAGASALAVIESFDAGINRLEQQSSNFKSVFDWRLSLVHDQQRIANTTLKNLAKLLRVPDFEKERLHLIEEGFRFYSRAAHDPDLYSDALDILHRAEALKPQDYHVLHRIGLIHLQSSDPRFIDLAKAEQYLRRAAKYARAELAACPANFDGAVAKLDQEFTDHDPLATNQTVAAVASECLRLAALACFVQEKYDDALNFAEDASNIIGPTAFEVPLALLEANYIKAKVLVALNRPESVPEILENIVEQAPTYAVRIVFDFGQIEPVHKMLTRLRDSKMQNAKSLWNDCRQFVRPGSKEAHTLYEINAELAKNTLIAAFDAEPRLETIWSSLVAQQQDRMLEVASEYKRERERLDRINEDGKEIEELLRQKHAEEQKQNRRWLFKGNTEMERIADDLLELAPEGPDQFDIQRKEQESKCEKLIVSLRDERKRSLEMQLGSSGKVSPLFSEDFLQMSCDLFVGRTEVTEKIFEDGLGLSADEASALMGEFESRRFVAPGQPGAVRKILVAIEENPVWWSPWLACPRTRERL
jgi:hypothetical protein